MSVYVDDMYRSPTGGFGRMKMSHLIADTHAELMAMVDRIGVAQKWIQQVGTYGEHFDICVSRRSKAVAAGAIEISMRELAMKTWERKGLEGKARYLGRGR